MRGRHYWRMSLLATCPRHCVELTMAEILDRLGCTNSQWAGAAGSEKSVIGSFGLQFAFRVYSSWALKYEIPGKVQGRLPNNRFKS